MSVEGYQIDLEGGRHVFVAEKPDKFLIQFCDENGNLTRLALSREAGDALRHLLGGQVPAPEMVKRFFAHMPNVVSGSKELVWQEVPFAALTAGKS